MIPERFAPHTYAIMRIVFGTMFMTHCDRASERALSPPFGEDHAAPANRLTPAQPTDLSLLRALVPRTTGLGLRATRVHHGNT